MTNKKTVEKDIKEVLPKRTKDFLAFQEFLLVFDPKLGDPNEAKNAVSQLLSDSGMVQRIAYLYKDYGDVIGKMIGANIFFLTQKLANDNVDGDGYMNPYNVQIYRRDIQTYKNFLKQFREIAEEFDRRVQDNPDEYPDETQTDDEKSGEG